MSLIAQNNTKPAHDIITMLSPLTIVHKSVDAESESYSIGFQHDKGYVYLHYIWGLVSLTIVEMWPMEVQEVYKRTPFTEEQRSVLLPWLEKNFKSLEQLGSDEN